MTHRHLRLRQRLVGRAAWLIALSIAAAQALPVRAQPPGPPSSGGDAGVDGSGSSETEPTELGASRLVEQLREAEQRIEADRATVAPSREVGTVNSRLRDTVRELASLSEATAPAELELAPRNRLVELQRLLGGVDSAITSHEETLAARLDELTALRERLDEERARWAERRAAAADPQWNERIDAVMSELAELKEQAGERFDATAEIGERVAEQRALLDEAMTRVRDAFAANRARIFSRTAPPIWSAFAESSEPAPLVDARDAWAAFDALYGQRLPVHGFFFLLFLGAIIALGRWAAANGTGDDDDSAILAKPVAAALMVGLVAMRFIYPRAPAAFFNIAGALALVPLLRLLPALVEERRLHRPIWALFGIFALRQLLVFAPLSAGHHRVSNLVVTLLLLSWVIFVVGRSSLRDALAKDEVARRVLPSTLIATGVALGVSAMAQVLGYTNLSDLLTTGVLVLIYVFFLLVAAVRVLDAIVSITLVSKLAQLSRAARLHGKLIEKKIVRLLYILATFIWLYSALRVFGVEESVLGALGDALGAEVTVGSWSLSAGDVLSFLLVLWLTLHAAKAVVFLVEQDVLPRLSLPRGVPATISRLVGYAIWALGLLVAIGAAGVDMSSVALLVSALGVGIGFGLQNVVNNFVSGLILIFERPIRIGDVVEVGGMVARVEDIGIRASIVRTLQGAEVIVPNADLVSAQVINWTLSDQQRRIDVPVGVAYGTDPQRVVDILLEAASGVEEVLDDPPPAGLFIGFGESSLDFELRFWVSLQHEWPTVASKLLIEVNRLLAEAEIEIPFPQRDLHVRTVSPEVAALSKKVK